MTSRCSCERVRWRAWEVGEVVVEEEEEVKEEGGVTRLLPVPWSTPFEKTCRRRCECGGESGCGE